MLELRPNCEACDRDLPADSPHARICSYECTFCADCVTGLLQNVCPNCGGEFTPRPVRPRTARREGVGLAHQPASTRRVLSRYSREEMAAFADAVKALAPGTR